MQRIVVYIKGPDRPGLLRSVSAKLAEMSVNILLSLAYVRGGDAYILLLTESPQSAESVEKEVRRVVGEGYEVEARIQAEAADLFARFLENNPGLASTLESYLEAADILDIIVRLPKDVARRVIESLSPETLAWIMEMADKPTLDLVVESLSITRILEAMKALDPDEAVDVLQRMDEAMRRRILPLLPPEYRRAAGVLLRYPPDTAGGIMTVSVPVLRRSDTVAKALHLVRSHDYDVKDTVVVVDGDGKLVGLVEVSDLLSNPPSAKLGSIARKPRVVVGPTEDQETVARLMLRYYQRRLPVVDGDGRFLGIIAIEDVAYVLAEEAAEDIAKLVGSEVPIERYITARVKDLVRARLPWLLIIYFIESITANVLKSYEHVLARAAVLAAFIPLIMGTGGNVGSQAVGLIIRALALGEVSDRSRDDILLVLRKELMTSIVIAIAFSTVGFAFALAVSRNMLVALAVAATLFLVIHFADIAGALLPIAARRAGIDPASVSTPLITTIVDVSVAFIYMTIASILLL